MAAERKPTEIEQLRLRDRLAKLREVPLLRGASISGELAKLERQIERIEAEPSADEIWQAVLLARHQDRPYTLDYVERLLEDWVELRGDRARRDDHAIVACDAAIAPPWPCCSATTPGYAPGVSTSVITGK